ncbi:hypothetical protein BDN71DRAFT_820666 [Pleurotus eryngii]|uniref:Uncharacterized protein n=1 Tax=Pleurotus eryngii TaxID=5323 RepID=A0A9P5ZFL7_PLEER|nr:hypothetical protein BDN71DRAFT_820666 [Pleurotus eryngii]
MAPDVMTVAQLGAGGTTGACIHLRFFSSSCLFRVSNLMDIHGQARCRYPSQRPVAGDGASMSVRWLNPTRHCRQRDVLQSILARLRGCTRSVLSPQGSKPESLLQLSQLVILWTCQGIIRIPKAQMLSSNIRTAPIGILSRDRIDSIKCESCRDCASILMIGGICMYFNV